MRAPRCACCGRRRQPCNYTRPHCFCASDARHAHKAQSFHIISRKACLLGPSHEDYKKCIHNGIVNYPSISITTLEPVGQKHRLADTVPYPNTRYVYAGLIGTPSPQKRLDTITSVYRGQMRAFTRNEENIIQVCESDERRHTQDHRTNNVMATKQ